MKINEIFYSLQGEGARAGSANVFVRFAKCNLTCSFCDTEFESYKEMTEDEIVQEIESFGCNNVIFTGGEPLLQLNSSLIKKLKRLSFYLAVETNGSITIPEGLDWVTVSPKVAEHVLKQNLSKCIVNELKYVINRGRPIPNPMIKAAHYYISPQFSGDNLDADSLSYCINLIKENPKWRLTTQNHKLWKVR